ncbi:hypothetical protein GTA08_BOTSDO07812 [Botryosphaeria dothidea]|uniref:SnoaL-like domain-containing protein n=1 Tax=Botryosphaeria dothidea TaxID=55169 RepID=A0A8H4N1P3_9PEZI|nr:hypothetical protein GTA08_BOTSDO07812 [Botryosphaeria dothidea]
MSPTLHSSKRNPWHLVSDRRGISSSGSGSSNHSSSSSNNESGVSVQRATALELVAAFNRNNIDAQTILEFLAPKEGFVREVLPRSLGQPPQQDAEGFQRTLNMFRAVFRHYALDVLEIVDDVPARKVCLWLTAHAATVAGKYVCDMVWTLTFDESGRRVVKWKEFLDAGARTLDFLPETMAGGAAE